MVAVADLFRRQGPRYRAQFGDRMPPSPLRALYDMEQCRTEALGGQVFYCEKCHDHQYSYHSCKHRHGPKCQKDPAAQWLENQKRLLLPVTHFLVTFTLPDQLRARARSHQKTLYHSLLRAAAAALQDLAADPRFLGGRLGRIGVLPTGTRARHYHPHVHSIVPGGGLAADGRWLSSRPDFLVPVKALALIFRAKFRDQLKKTGRLSLLDPRVGKKDWVVHCEPVASGQAAFRYLAPYLFRVAISNNRSLKLEEGRVTFQYQESATDQTKFCTLSAQEFLRRFLQHVLPDRFIKVR